jgi:hypothetical protein
MYAQKYVIGGFLNTFYWSSSEYSSNDVWVEHYNNGYQTYAGKIYAYSVRAARAF